MVRADSTPDRDYDHDHDHDHGRIRSAGRDADTVRRAADLLQAIADPARLGLVELISHGEVCVAELVAATGANESTVSQRLRTLRDRRVVTTRRDGKHIFYSLADDHVRELVEAVLDHVDHLHDDAQRPDRTTLSQKGPR